MRRLPLPPVKLPLNRAPSRLLKERLLGDTVGAAANKMKLKKVRKKRIEIFFIKLIKVNVKARFRESGVPMVSLTGECICFQ